VHLLPSRYFLGSLAVEAIKSWPPPCSHLHV